jgi:hypothetical protein
MGIGTVSQILVVRVESRVEEVGSGVKRMVQDAPPPLENMQRRVAEHVVPGCVVGIIVKRIQVAAHIAEAVVDEA